MITRRTAGHPDRIVPRYLWKYWPQKNFVSRQFDETCAKIGCMRVEKSAIYIYVFVANFYSIKNQQS